MARSAMAIGSFHRPPSQKGPESLFQLSNILLALDATRVILAGDFNLPNIEWVHLQPKSNTSSLLYSAFCEMINAHSLFQFVSRPTRLGSSCNNVLDLIFCNDQTLISSVTTIPGISDHEVVVGTISCDIVRRPNPLPRKVFYYNRGDYVSLSRELDQFLPEFRQHATNLDLNTTWHLFKTKLLSLIRTNVPSRVLSSKRRTSKPWMNSSLKALINRRHRVYRKYRQTPQRELHETLKELNKSVAKQMRCAELEHLGRLTDRIKNNPKEVWKYVKSKQAVKETIPDVIDDLSFSADLKGKAERFNFYFQSVFTQSVCLPSGPQLEKIQK